MGDVYKKAFRTIIFLGEETGMSAQMFSIMKSWTGDFSEASF